MTAPTQNDFGLPLGHQAPLTSRTMPPAAIFRLLVLTAFYCSICLNENVLQPIIAIPCGHTICHECIRGLIRHSLCRAKCPLCRRWLSLVTDWVYVAALHCPERLDKRTLAEVEASMRDGKGVVVIGDGPGLDEEDLEGYMSSDDGDEGIELEEHVSSDDGSEGGELEEHISSDDGSEGGELEEHISSDDGSEERELEVQMHQLYRLSFIG
ncbi:hypothetical protein HBI24_118340 [Parastagonospora nodorum]|nr:hypothetical protein HBH53_073810 [Parastagonospora nodorum]KAH3965752.1 hypothetical protein HBH51_147950 [Parastagonospora nodorum]KAH3974010.1 hypothetical protein HBH52_137980 [Parastagonospora nodorum]KAH3998685.1 hypothetical protein HBI10_124950 [Parastagonospora nodorum]KAH4024227.1 hypothetical protein HBI13_084570 [Parastagonospora nodorum]